MDHDLRMNPTQSLKNSAIALIWFREEFVNRWHDLRWSLADKLPRFRFCIFSTFFKVVKNSGSSVFFGYPASDQDMVMKDGLIVQSGKSEELIADSDGESGNQAYFAAYQLEFLDAAVYRHCSATDNVRSSVITVAHRIPTAIDNDLVLVLDKGKLMEYDTPKILLNDNSFFSTLVAEILRLSESKPP
ncbi:hypothetical protein V6N11_067607 [Hibiscus sabdariffa]|uniref:Uncharacterized protein n=1 Tax=Hibiscus sabdariffa TaxID=183260 RepID=A0ABR2SS48_9ROSI